MCHGRHRDLSRESRAPRRISAFFTECPRPEQHPCKRVGQMGSRRGAARTQKPLRPTGSPYRAPQPEIARRQRETAAPSEPTQPALSEQAPRSYQSLEIRDRPYHPRCFLGDMGEHVRSVRLQRGAARLTPGYSRAASEPRFPEFMAATPRRLRSSAVPATTVTTPTTLVYDGVTRLTTERLRREQPLAPGPATGLASPRYQRPAAAVALLGHPLVEPLARAQRVPPRSDGPRSSTHTGQ